MNNLPRTATGKAQGVQKLQVGKTRLSLAKDIGVDV